MAALGAKRSPNAAARRHLLIGDTGSVAMRAAAANLIFIRAECAPKRDRIADAWEFSKPQATLEQVCQFEAKLRATQCRT